MMCESHRVRVLGWLSILLAALLVSACGDAKQSQDASQRVTIDDNAGKFVTGAREKLAAIGYIVSAQVRAETRTSKQVIADLDAQQDVLLPSGSFELQHQLFDALDLRVGRDAAALREKTVAEMARGLSAYYDPIRKAFVMLPSMTRSLSDAVAGDASGLVTHELVHACQDARDGGLLGFFDRDHATIDETTARRIVIEGEADFASTWAITGPESIRLLTANKRTTDLNAILAGELTAALYAAGRNLAAKRYAADGPDGVLALWNDPPTSAEQALHPSKLAVDLPSEVSVPAIQGLQIARATTMGELMVFFVLRQLHTSRLDALIASAGWDGDQLVLFDEGDASNVALVWRTVWDRAEDANDFAEHIRGYGETEVVLDGHVVDLIAADESAMRTRVLAACAADRAQPTELEADAASTAAIEAAIREEVIESTHEAGRWNHEALGLSIPILDGWKPRDVRGTEMLFHTPSKTLTFEANVNVSIQPKGAIKDIDALIAASKSQFQQLKITIVDIRAEQRGDIDVMISECSGRIGNLPFMHILNLGFLRDEEQVFVTIVASKSQWKSEQENMRKIIAGILITQD